NKPRSIADDAAFNEQLLLLAAASEKNEIEKKLLDSNKIAQSTLADLEKTRNERNQLSENLKLTQNQKKQLSEKLSSEIATKNQISSELSSIRSSFSNLAKTNQESIDKVAKLSEENSILNDSRRLMRSKLAESLTERNRNEEELNKLKEERDKLSKQQAALVRRVRDFEKSTVQLQANLKIAEFKAEELEKSKTSIELKYDSTMEEKNQLAAGLAASEQQKSNLSTQVSKLNKQIYGPSPEINRALYQIRTSFSYEGVISNQSASRKVYSPIVKINQLYFTVANYEKLAFNYIRSNARMINFNLEVFSESLLTTQKIQNFYYLAENAKTILIPCKADPNAIEISEKVQAVADFLPTYYFVKQDTGKVLKLENIFYDNPSKRLILERGLAEEASANTPELGDLIVDENGKLIGIFQEIDRSWSLAKTARLQAFVFTPTMRLQEIKVANPNSIPEQFRSLHQAIK
ncbi:MAG: hypothetical protein ACRC37_04220, partial [Lentisphaeria bacterium]